MSFNEPFQQRIYSRWSELADEWSGVRASLGRVVFTNGCFDILHCGHVSYLEEARNRGDFLLLGLNSDASVRRLKGASRPFNRFEDRGLVLAGLRAVDLVVGFDQDTPLQLIESIGPDILVKGGDWSSDQIVGSEFVLARGGVVESLSLVEGRSTTSLVEKVADLARRGLL